MFSPMKLDIDLTQEVNGTLLEKADLNKTSKVKIHIPVLMQLIGDSKVEKKIVQTNGLSVFKNIEGRPNISSRIIYEQNYLETNTSGSENASSIESAVNLVTENINKWVPKTITVQGETVKVASQGSVSLKYNQSKGSTVRCKFLNGKISKLSFSTTASTTKAKKSI